MKYFILSVFCLLFISSSVFAANYKSNLNPKYKTVLAWNDGECTGDYNDKWYPCPSDA